MAWIKRVLWKFAGFAPYMAVFLLLTSAVVWTAKYWQQLALWVATKTSGGNTGQ